jgi:hypothetical protein
MIAKGELLKYCVQASTLRREPVIILFGNERWAVLTVCDGERWWSTLKGSVSE